jgi:predicted DNA-binding transcriptional regulator YafY
MLGHQLPALPPLEAFLEELERLFAWLEGRLTVEMPKAMPRTAAEEAPERWAPPATVWTWGAGVPLETVRFAAANHLCIQLGYRGETRVIEPYSLRRTRDGNLILHGVRTDSRESRSYRVDRIESVEVTNQPFRPVYLVEFSNTGPIEAAPTTTAGPRARSLSRAATRRSGWIYILECTYCRKRFRRRTQGTTLRRHKDRRGYACAGRHGYVVDTRYV